MRRVLLGLVLGLLLSTAAQGQESAARLDEVPMETYGRTAFKLPDTYGHLVSVVVDANVHYLYFEDATGTIRVVLVGPRGAVPRSRSPLQLLSSDVYLIKRGEAPAP